ncbi:hypothetical protein [Amaricoccus sp. W119]|uniref:hypothetical protein n=1 Tax=Amaricoccus sp. W119 TaxID=3391833 RepID=UPI0039A621FD
MAEPEPEIEISPVTNTAREDRRPADLRFQPYRLARLLLLIASILVSLWILATLVRLVTGL